MDDIVIDIIDVRVGFLFVVDGDLLKEFGRVSLLDKDIDEVALADLEFVCDRVIVVDDVVSIVYGFATTTGASSIVCCFLLNLSLLF